MKKNKQKGRSSKSIKKIKKNIEYLNTIHQFNLTDIYRMLLNTAKQMFFSHTHTTYMKTDHKTINVKLLKPQKTYCLIRTVLN